MSSVNGQLRLGRLHRPQRAALGSSIRLLGVGAVDDDAAMSADAFTTWLLREVGTWDASVDVFVGPPSPGGGPTHSEGTLVAEAVADRWLRTRFLNDSSGFNGAGLYGNDALKNHPVAVWVDTQTTFVTVGKGRWDGENVVDYAFEAEVPGKGKLAWREAHTRVSDDEKRFESFFEKPDGGTLHIMTIVYRRRRPH